MSPSPSPKRLLYEGAPVLGRGLTQDAAARRARVVEGRALNTAAVVLTEAEKAELATLQAAEKTALWRTSRRCVRGVAGQTRR